MKQWAAAASAPGEATVEYENSAVNSNGWEFSVVEGSIGSRVSGVTLTLSDGSSVVATVDNGIFAAWWPSQATVSLIQAQPLRAATNETKPRPCQVARWDLKDL